MALLAFIVAVLLATFVVGLWADARSRELRQHREQRDLDLRRGRSDG
jgi:hypothetical protein